ncbi:MAG: hypothetical protein LBC76_06390 [Treponema sp.]|jgi:hypothetical protein|nr:hypothetical protein [Treponema sp.]
MKKLWMVLSVLLVIGIGTARAQVWTTDAPSSYSIKLAKNQWSPGNIAVVKGSWVFKGNRIKAGETYEVELTFKSNREFKDLQVVIVDGSETAEPKWWMELTEYNEIEGTIPKDTEINKKLTFTTLKGATAGSNDANSITFTTIGSPKDATVTLTFSKFTVTRVK